MYKQNFNRKLHQAKVKWTAMKPRSTKLNV